MTKMYSSILALGTMLLATVVNAQDVTTEVLENAQELSDRWVHYGKNYGAWRYMPDDQINKETVADLSPVWIKQTGVTGGAFEVTAMVNDGRMYLTTANIHLIVVDPMTGDTL